MKDINKVSAKDANDLIDSLLENKNYFIISIINKNNNSFNEYVLLISIISIFILYLFLIDNYLLIIN